MAGIVRREAYGDPVARNHPDAKTAHSARELRGDDLARFQRDLIATAAEDLVDGSRRLNQIVPGQTNTPGNQALPP